ncbi:MAG: exosortase/archaeosortase family protein [Verrucomicrobiota bacterium]
MNNSPDTSAAAPVKPIDHRLWVVLAAPLAYWGWVTAYVGREWLVNPEYYFGVAIPVLAAVLLRQEKPWRARPTDVRRPRLGLALLLLAWPLLIAGELIKPHAVVFSRAASWALVLSAVLTTCGVWLRWWGRGALWRLAPVMLLFILAVPLPHTVWGELSAALRLLVSSATTDVLNLFGVAARQQGNIIFTARGAVGVDEACSGLRSLQATLAAGLFIGMLSFRTWPYRLALLGGSVVTVLLTNLVRSTILTWLVHKNGLTSVREYHDPAGFGTLFANMILLAVASALMVRRERIVPPADEMQFAPVSIGRRGAWLAASAVMLVLALQLALPHGTAWVPDKDFRQLGALPATVSGYALRHIPVEPSRPILMFDSAVDAHFLAADGTDIQVFNAFWGAGKVSNQFVGQHVPTICYQNSGYLSLSTSRVAPVTLRGREYPVVWQTFSNDRESVLVGFLHLVGGQPRTFRLEDRGLFSWRTLLWDIRFQQLAPQEVFIFSINYKGDGENALSRLKAALLARYP